MTARPWIAVSSVLSLLVGVVAAPARAGEPEPAPLSASSTSTAPSLRLWTASAGRVGLRAPSLDGQASLALTWRPTPLFEPEVLVGAGVAPPIGVGASPPRATNRFAVGVRSSLPEDLVDLGPRPLAWLAFHHGHEVAFEDLLARPAAALSGASDAGVAHASGLEVGAGVVFPLDVAGNAGAPLELMVRAGVLWMPALLGDLERFEALVDVGVGVPLGFPS